MWYTYDVILFNLKKKEMITHATTRMNLKELW